MHQTTANTIAEVNTKTTLNIAKAVHASSIDRPLLALTIDVT
jgi:hypothetical protein